MSGQYYRSPPKIECPRRQLPWPAPLILSTEMRQRRIGKLILAYIQHKSRIKLNSRLRLNIQFDYMNIVMLEYRQIFDQSVCFETGNKILDAGTGTGAITYVHLDPFCIHIK